jgi:hypothetical protein
MLASGGLALANNAERMAEMQKSLLPSQMY